MTQLKFSIVGASSISSKYVQILKRFDGVSIESIYSRSLDMAREFASDHGINHFTEWTDHSLNKDTCDAVIICTEPLRHAEIAMIALDAGKHVMIEKPLDTDINRARALLLKSATAGRIVSVVSQRRFESVLIRMKEEVDEIRQGSPLTIQLLLRRSRNEEYYQEGSAWRLKDGAIFLEQDIHWIDVLHWFFGKPVNVFSISHKSREFLECPDFTGAIFEFNNGDIATIAGGAFYGEQKPPEFVVYGKAGTLNYQDMQRSHLTGKTVSSIARRIGIKGMVEESPLYLQVLDFINAIRDNRTPVTTLENAYQALETALQISTV